MRTSREHEFACQDDNLKGLHTLHLVFQNYSHGSGISAYRI